MTTVNLDAIIRRVLLRKGYSIHWYLDALLAGSDCLREITFDDLAVINTVKIQLNDAFAGQLPPDFQDWVEVCVQSGQMLRPLVPTNKINPLIYRVNGTPTPYNDISNQNDVSGFWNLSAGFFWRTVTWNQYGENVGRLFGYNVGYNDTFSIFRERNEIQVNEMAGVTEIVLIYISDGSSSDAASQIDTYAFNTIQEYIMWQFKEMNRSYSEGEKERARQLYLKERGILRARKADWSIQRIKRISYESNYASPKH